MSKGHRDRVYVFCFLGSTKCKNKTKLRTRGDYSNMMSTEIKLLHVIWATYLVNGTLLRKVSITLKPDHAKTQIMFGEEWEPKSKHINCLC